MTITEYYKRVAEIEKLSSTELEFLRNVCKSVGHTYFRDVNRFGDVCTRCGFYKSWMLTTEEIQTQIDKLKRIIPG